MKHMKHYNIMKMTKDYNKYTANWYKSYFRRQSLK